tara:strand:+ start:1557 stop:1802 length:246 start_codon:yes stop_codon:yes gene_type:complete
MRLFKMIANRERKFKTWTPNGYIRDSYKEPVLDILIKYIMLHLLNMDYYWMWMRGPWGKGLRWGFYKIHTLESLLGEPENE